MRQETGDKTNPARVQLVSSSKFVSYYNRVFECVRRNEYVHPKLEKLKEFLVDHFRRNAVAERETRVIVFAQYRSSVQEILNYLRGTSYVRATAFVGQQKKNGDVAKIVEEGAVGEQLYDAPPPKQSRSIGSFFGKPDDPPVVTSSPMMTAANGQTQKQQQAILKDFKSGKYNVLVATCIAEEGLDIGEVDLLICYEGVSSPTRLLQRKGRTGRKRAGRVVVLLTEGSEYQKHRRSIQKYNKVTGLLKNKASLLKLCPAIDTLFPSDFHPQLIQESLIISDYHYSQIGGHTPKKRSHAQEIPYQETAGRRSRREHFFSSETGRELLRELEKDPRDGELDTCGLSAALRGPVHFGGETYQCDHSVRSKALAYLQDWMEKQEWNREYSVLDTSRWMEEGKNQSFAEKVGIRLSFIVKMNSGKEESDASPRPLLNEIGNLSGDEASADEFEVQTRRNLFGLKCDSRYEAQMSVLDMVERKTNEMLRRLDTDYVHRSPSPSFREIETPSVLREVDAYIGSKEQTEIPASSLDAVLAEDSDLNPPNSSEEESDSVDEPLINMAPGHDNERSNKREEPQEVKDVSIVDVADDSSDVPLASFVNKEEESSSSDGTLLGDLLSKSVMESLERVNAKRKQLQSQKEESVLEEVMMEEESDEKPIGGVASDSSVGEKEVSDSSVAERQAQQPSATEERVSELSVDEEEAQEPSVAEKRVPEPLVNEKPVSSHAQKDEAVSKITYHNSPLSDDSSQSDISSDDDKPIGALKSLRYNTDHYASKESISRSEANPPLREAEKKLPSPKETTHSDSPVQEAKGGVAKSMSPHHPKQPETTTVQQTKGPASHPNEELQGSAVKDTSVSTSTGSSIPVVVSSFSALESQPHLQSLNSSPSVKPPPLSHDAIDRLFPRLPLVSNPSTTKEKPVSLQGVVCPLCLTMSS